VVQNGEGTEGSRYRWIGEEEGGSRTRIIEGESYQTTSGRYTGSLVTLYGKGEAVGLNRSASIGTRGGAVYLGKDVLGSVRTGTDEYGALEDRYEYDAFGKPYKGDMSRGMNLGYTGKPYDRATGLYNYGYRDYKPEAARFTTADPVRDGANWFAYVNNDPVNWVDLWGLKASDKPSSPAISGFGLNVADMWTLSDPKQGSFPTAADLGLSGLGNTAKTESASPLSIAFSLGVTLSLTHEENFMSLSFSVSSIGNENGSAPSKPNNNEDIGRSAPIINDTDFALSNQNNTNVSGFAITIGAAANLGPISASFGFAIDVYVNPGTGLLPELSAFPSPPDMSITVTVPIGR
jgi:RHS repeat-associated protein